VKFCYKDHLSDLEKVVLTANQFFSSVTHIEIVHGIVQVFIEKQRLKLFFTSAIYMYALKNVSLQILMISRSKHSLK